MIDNEETFSLSDEGRELVAKVLTKAERLGHIQLNKITKSNIPDHCKSLAEVDELWPEILTERNRDDTVNNRKVLLAFGLVAMAEANLNIN